MTIKGVKRLSNKTIGQMIHDIRINLGETMEEFGKRFNTSKGTVNNWEKGRNLPNKANLKSIADLAGISVEELLNGNTEDRLFNLFYNAIDENSDLYSEDLLHRVIKYLDTYENLSDIMLSIEDPETAESIEDQIISDFFTTSINGFIEYFSNIDFNNPDLIINSYIQYINIISAKANETYKGAESIIMKALDTIDPYFYTNQTLEEILKDEDFKRIYKDKSQLVEKYFISKLYKNIQDKLFESNTEYWSYQIENMNHDEDDKE